MTPSPSSVFRRPHCRESFLIYNLILIRSFERTAVFSVLSKKRRPTNHYCLCNKQTLSPQWLLTEFAFNDFDRIHDFLFYYLFTIFTILLFTVIQMHLPSYYFSQPCDSLLNWILFELFAFTPLKFDLYWSLAVTFDIIF